MRERSPTRRSRPLVRVSGRVAAVEDYGVSVAITTRCEKADARVPRLGEELDALRFEFGPSLGDICHSHCEPGRVRDERQTLAFRLPKLSVTFGVSTSPSETSLSGSPRTSRYHATARPILRVGIEMKSTCSTRTTAKLPAARQGSLRNCPRRHQHTENEPRLDAMKERAS